MNEAEARKILGTDVKEDGGLHCVAPWVSWKPGDTSVELDGDFSALELRAIAYWMSRVAASVAAPETPSDWRPITTAPKDRSVMLFAPYGLIYCGRKRYGQLGEPQQDQFAWRCDSSGRYSNPTHWMHLPPHPKTEGSI